VATRLYGIVWRWHFLAGLAAAPLIVVIAVTGIAYAFEPELSVVLDDRARVAPGAPAALDAVIAAAASPACRPAYVDVPSARDRAIAVSCAGDDRHSVLVDPARAVVVGDRVGRSFFDVVYDLHWELALGRPGRIAIEWATSWMVVLFISGAVLWWPRGKRRDAWWPRRGVKLRQTLRSLHAVIGVYALPILFVIAATGLMWTVYAGGERWRVVSHDAASDRLAHAPKSQPGGARVSLDRALANAHFAPGTAAFVTLPAEATDPIVAYLFDDSQRRTWQAETVFLDAYTGAVLDSIGWADRSTLAKLDSIRYSLHTGAILGLPGRILACLASAVLAGLAITGVWMWWRRRPIGGLGVPPRARRVPLGLVAAWGVAGIVLPLVGWTVIAALAIEIARWALARRA
jgi:uncharacterized iron-regulated membrane protein